MERVSGTGRDQWASTVFTTWVVLGLFLDGWAHNAGKPEDFFTPWHAVLYSGFIVGAGWFALERRRASRAGVHDPMDRLLLAGFAAFAVAGVGDGIWHSIFGVEEDVAALLSPTHLALMIGGVLLVTGPIRAVDDLDAPDRTWRDVVPVVTALVLTVAVIGFFLQFLSAFHIHGSQTYSAPTDGGTLAAMNGVANVLVTNLVLLGGLAWALARWRRPPAGTCTAMLAGPALLFSSLHAFEHVWLVGAAVLGGIVADVLVARGRSRGVVLAVSAAVTWSAWFAIHHAVWGIGWEVEFWSGTIVFTILTAIGLELLLRAPVRATGEGGRPPSPATAPVTRGDDGRPVVATSGSTPRPV